MIKFTNSIVLLKFATHFRSYSMSKKIILRILIAILAIIILILILLPGIVKRYAVNNSKELVGRQIEMDKIKLNYFTGMIRITDFKMYEADDRNEFVSFDTLIVNLEPFQFFVSEFVLESFYLKGFEANVIQYDSTFNFDDLIAFHAPEEDTINADTMPSEPFRFQLSNIELKDAEFVFDDRTINKTTDLKEISFFIPFIGWNQQDKSEAGLKFAFKNDGYFESSINVDPIEGAYDAEITIQKLYLNAFTEYAAKYAKVNTLDGTFNSQIKIAGNIKEAEKSLISGYVEILDFVMEDQQNKKFLGTKRLDCVLKEVDVDNMSFIVDTLLLTEPYVYFEMDTVSNNFYHIFEIIPESGDSLEISEVSIDTVTESSDSIYYAINFIQIREGILDYRDNITGVPFDYNLSEITMDSDSIKSTSQWIDLYSQMLLNKRGTLKAEVGVNPSNPLDIKLDYVITDFQLGDLNIYSRHYMGFPIVYGDMYYKSETEILNGQLTSDNKLVIKHVELGNKKGGLYSLPLKFALFILKDRHGVINLDIPVRGDLNDPQVSVGKIIWATFKNLIIKVAAKPFDMLSGLLNVDPSDIESIVFDYQDTTLTDKRKKQLDLLLELEQKKEGLGIELVYFNDDEIEKEVIALDEVGKMFYKKTSKDYYANEDEFREFVKSIVPNDTLEVTKACLQIADITMVDSLAKIYSESRYAIVNNYLKSVNDSTAIRSSIANPKAPKNAGSLPLFEVKYTMSEEAEEKE